MKIFPIVLILLSAAGSLAGDSTTDNLDVACLFEMNSHAICTHGDMRVSMRFIKVADDESKLISIEVAYLGKKHYLRVSPDTTLTRGEQGLISFEDINFDNFPDIAVSTSFGVANLYMDYWIFNRENNNFLRIGNYSRFSLDPKNKTLSNTVKISAKRYKKNTYSWHGSKLIKKNDRD